MSIHLLPVTWMEGWPIIGKDVDGDGIGEMVWGGVKRIDGHPAADPSIRDDFDRAELRPQWERNHQPRADKWCLQERTGFLRLHACRPLERDNFFTACNTLTLRSFRTVKNVVTVKVDISSMADGQEAGLCHFAKSFCTIGIQQHNGRRYLKYCDTNKVEFGAHIEAPVIWFKSEWNIDGINRYAFSVDGENFTVMEGSYQLGWGKYRGDRVGIYCFNNEKELWLH